MPLRQPSTLTVSLHCAVSRHGSWTVPAKRTEEGWVVPINEKHRRCPECKSVAIQHGYSE